MLLRVPGLGSKAVGKIIEARRHATLRLDDLKRLTRGMKRLQSFLVTADHHPGLRLDEEHLRQRFVPKPQQLSLF